jgi:hypothetical protein
MKNILLHISANQKYKCRRLIPKRGASAVATDRGGWDAVDAGSALDEALSAYGEVVWSWRRDAGVKLAVILQVTVTTSPFTGESSK